MRVGLAHRHGHASMHRPAGPGTGRPSFTLCRCQSITHPPCVCAIKIFKMRNTHDMVRDMVRCGAHMVQQQSLVTIHVTRSIIEVSTDRISIFNCIHLNWHVHVANTNLVGAKVKGITSNRPCTYQVASSQLLNFFALIQIWVDPRIQW